MPLVVYKLGGSLLTLSNLDRRLLALVNNRVPLPAPTTAIRPLQRVVLVGGGRAADVVRDWDRSHPLGDERSHDLALRAMGLNARLVSALLGDAPLIAKKNAIGNACAGGALAIADPFPLLDEAERRADEQLPRSWDVTSDSIAAFLAIQWRAAALVLIKSRSLPATASTTSAARRGAVDRFFPQLAERIPVVAWANLRSRRPVIERWL